LRIIFHLSRFAWRVLLACLFSTALALSVVRFWLLPEAAQWREELQAAIDAMTGETVHIKSLSAGMRGFKPELMMRGFLIDNAAGIGPVLAFERLGVGLDLIDSVMAKRPVINRIELEGGRLRLFHKPDGSVGVSGLKPSEHPPAWLFAEGEVRLSDIDLEWAEGADGPALPLGRAHARLRNQGGSHLLDVRVDLLGKLGKSLRLSADIEGNPLLATGWNGRAFVEAKRLREGAFAESLALRMRSGEIGFQAWGEWRDGGLREVVGKLDLDRPVFVWHGAGRPDGMLNLDKLAGAWRWQGTPQAWRLDVQKLSLAHGGKSWPATDFAVAVDQGPDGGLQAVRAAFGYLRLDDWLALLGGAPVLDDQTKDVLRTLSPRGEARDVRLDWQADGRFGFCGELAGLSFNQTQDWPGLGRFTGRLCGNDRDGHIDLNLAKTDLRLPGLFPAPVPLDALSGRLEWRRTGGGALLPREIASPSAAPEAPGPPPGETPGLARKLLAGSAWRIVGNGLRLAAPGLQARGGFALDLPAEEGGSPSVDLDVHLHGVDAIRLKDYLPVVAMAPEAAKWHSNAYHGGKVAEIDVLLRGRLADFPFPNGEGLFEARVATENMDVEFNPQWPRLYGLKAKILLFGPTMFIDSEGGRIGDIPLNPIHAETASLVGDAWVGMTSYFDSDLAPALKFLQQTPARFIPQRLAKAFDTTGPAHLDLRLDVPLNAGEVGVAGRLQLQNDTLALKGVNLKVRNLSGDLDFNGQGISGKQIAGFALDQPILVDVDQHGDDILLDVSGKAGMDALRQAFPGELWRHAEGGFDYRLNLAIPKSLDSATDPLRIGLSSDLAGLELKLPAPLAKPAAAKKELNAALTLRRGGNSSLNLVYGAEGRARLAFSNTDGFSLDSGDVFWGKPQVPASGESGLGLYLKLGALDLGVWRKLLADIGVGAASAVPRALDIQVDSLSWNGDDLGPLRLSGRREDGEFAGEVDCKYAKGAFSAAMPEFGQAAVRLDLDSLNLPKLADDPSAAPPNPASLPSLQIHARQLLRQGADLGELDLETERWTSGMNIKKLSLRSENHELGVRGGWMRQEGRDETKVEGKLKVGDLGSFLGLLGYGREILATPTESVFSLSWQGAPQQFSAAALAGEVKLKMGRGSVLQVEPGLGRALGMLNLHTLRRLLLLDFSDLFGKGLVYDGMEGVFNLQAGQAQTKGFFIDAAAADILTIGRVGLAEHDFEQYVSVMPHPLASIPLAVPMVGGAAVGAVIDMAHRLVGEEDVNLASSNYAVSGTWDNPQIKRVEGATPLEVINRAWSGIKGMSGLSGNEDGVGE